jgi:putative tryptophan/tyrosine transport system ATP-binding protein
MIRLEKVSVVYNQGTNLEKTALKNVSLIIQKEEFVTVIGGNGAGKSTLLSVITGNTEITNGKVLFDNIDVTKWPPEQRSALIARVFQDPLKGTCGSLTIEENLALAYRRGQRRGVQLALTPETRDFFISYLKRLKLGLESRMKAYVSTLSGGQRQAISLIMAVLAPMKILLLDEHTAALDPRMASFIVGLTHDIVEEKKLTTLMITHSVHQALEVGTIMLHEGEIVYDIQGHERDRLTPHNLMEWFEKFDAV